MLFYLLLFLMVYILHLPYLTSTELNRGRRGRNRMVVGFTTTCAISAYHH